MVAAGFEVVQGGVAPQNVLLAIGLVFALGALLALLLGAGVVLDTIVRTARGLYFRRRLWAWRVIWALAVPTIGPLALITPALIRADARLRTHVRALAGGPSRWASWRRPVGPPAPGTT